MADKPTRYEMASGTEFEVPECNLTAPAGKVFSHWSTTKDGNGGVAYRPGEKIKVYGNIHLYPIWRNIDQ